MKPKTALRNFLLGFALLSTSTAFAATLTWDNGAATGNWNTTDLNWTGAAWNNATPDDAVFDATGVGTVTLTEAITAGSITFGTAGYTVDTSTFGLTLNTGITATQSAGIVGATALTLGGNTLWSVAGTKTLAAGVEIGGAFGITKTGDGTLELSGANTYSGGTTISAGTVTFGSATALGSGSLSFDNAGTASSTAVFSVEGTRANAITVASGSTGVNTIQTTNLTGTVKLDGAMTVVSGTTLKLDNSGSVLDFGTGVISGNGSVETTGTSTGNLIIRGDNTYSGGTLLSGSNIHVPALGTTGPEGSPTSGPFGTGTLTINNASMRSTTVADTSIGNGIVLAGNFSAVTSTTEKNLTFAGPVTLTGTRTISSTVGNTVAGRSLIISGAIGDGGNDFGLIKEGGGSLTLAGANTYTGNTTLNGGTVVISNANSFGAGDVLVTGNSRINAAALNYANDISIDATSVLTLGTTGAANSTSTFSGAIAGDGGITLAQGASGGTTVNLSSTSNTFTGNITLPTAAGTNDFINFASIGDGGSIIFGRASWLANARYTGAADIVWNTRTISLATTIGIASGLDGSGNPSHMFANNGAGTATINTDIGVTSTATSTIFFLGGTNTGNNTFAGAIGDPTGANTLGIGKAGTGRWILSNNTNSYEGKVIIHDGTLSVANIDLAANAQPLGKGSLIQFGYRTANTGTVEYTGAANASTDKQIEVGQLSNATNNNFRGGGVILNNGDGTLTFSNPTFNSIAGVPGTGTGHVRNLTLGGTNTGANTISGIIRNNNTTIGALVSLTKTGAGTWVLEGDNSYTGTTAIQSGLLVANHVNAIGTGAITLAGNAILGLGAGDFTRLPNFNATVSGDKITFLDSGGFAAFGADRVVNFGGANGIVAIGSTATPGVIGNMNGKTFILGHATATHKVTVTNILDFGGGSRTIQVNDGAAAVDAEISGTIQPQAGGTGGFTKTGAGTLLLSGANTYIGGTTVSAGTLTLNGSLADATMAISTGATVNCTATGTLTYNVDGITADQVVNAGTMNLNGLTVAVNASGAGLTEAEYILVDATGGGTISGTFAGVTGATGYTLDYGTPNQVKLVQSGGDPYETWAGPGVAFDGDENADGVSNGLAFLLGAADPDANALDLLPTVDENAGGLVLTFSMLDAASRGTATLAIEHSSDLGIADAWEEAEVPATSSTVNDVVFGITGSGPLDVEATIPVGKASGGKLFGRLKAVRP